MTLSTRLLLLIIVAPLLLVAITPLPLFAQEPDLDLQAETLSDQYGIQLSWNEIASDHHVEIERSDNGVSAWEAWGESSGNQWVDALVACSHSYSYRARIVDAVAVNGPWSDVITAVVAPCAPIVVTVYPVPGWYILDVTWLDIALEETSYRIERSLDGESWSELAELLPNSGFYADRFGVAECSRPLFYRLRTERDGVFSPYTASQSNAVSPCAPAILWAELVDDDERVRLRWRDNAPDETAFEVWRRSDVNSTSQLIATVPLAEAVGSTVLWDDESPDCQTWNYYQIRALRGADSASPWEPHSPVDLKVYVPNCPEPASNPVAELSVHPLTTLPKPSPIDDWLDPLTPFLVR